MSRSIDRRTFLKSVAVLAAAAPAAALAGADARADDAPVVVTGTPPPPAGPDFSICRTPAERTMLETQYGSAFETAKVIRAAPLLPDAQPVTAFAALPRTISAEAPPPDPAPGTPRRPEEK